MMMIVMMIRMMTATTVVDHEVKVKENEEQHKNEQCR